MPITQVVPLVETYHPVFLSKFFEPRNVLFESNEVQTKI
jgi:hypothetical protein